MYLNCCIFNFTCISDYLSIEFESGKMLLAFQVLRSRIQTRLDDVTLLRPTANFNKPVLLHVTWIDSSMSLHNRPGGISSSM